MQGTDQEAVSAAVLEALFTQSPQGLFVFDRELRVIRYNTAGRGVRGLPEAEVLGHRVDRFAPGFDAADVLALAGEVIATGRHVRDHLLTGRSPARPARKTTLAVSMFRIQDADGNPYGVASVEDVTDRQAALERLDLLNTAHRQIGGSLDAADTAEELAAVVVPRFADAITVDLLDEALRGRALRAGPVDAATPLRRAAFRSVRGPQAGGGGEALGSYPEPTPFARSLDDARPRLIAELGPEEPWFDADPARARRLLEAGVHSLMVVPLTVHGTVLGVVGLYRHQRAEPFTPDDLDLAGELCARAALSIDKARSYARERAVATTLQRHLLPAAPPVISAADTAHLYLPGTIGNGGDWYDVIPLSGTRVGLAIGAVGGSGIEAAATMGQLRTAVRTLAVLDLPPDELLARLDETARVLGAEQSATLPDADGPPDGLASCLYLVYDPVTRSCSAASAGHPGPAIAGPDGIAIPFDVPSGPRLGDGHGLYETAALELPEGSVLALYTEGLVAARRPGVADCHQTLERVIADPGRELGGLADDAVYALVRERPRDDVLLLLVRTRALADDLVAVWTLPEDPAVVGTARRLAEHQLGVWGLTELEFTTDLIVSELVTNAIRYGSGPIRLRLINDQGLICEVTDGASSAPHLRRASSTDEGGRGLFIVGQLARRWGTRFARRGKTIWAEQSLPER